MKTLEYNIEKTVMYYRSALDAEIQRYVSESYPKGVSTVNCVKGKYADGPGTDFELVVIITARKLSPQNFWCVPPDPLLIIVKFS